MFELYLPRRCFRLGEVDARVLVVEVADGLVDVELYAVGRIHGVVTIHCLESTVVVLQQVRWQLLGRGFLGCSARKVVLVVDLDTALPALM